MIDNKTEALKEIKNLSENFNITSQEIINLLDNNKNILENRFSFAQIFLSYISSIFIFAGLCIYISIIWEQLNIPARIIITFGPGLVSFIISIFSINNIRFQHISTPLLLISAVLEPLGITVILNNYFPNLNTSVISSLIICLIMFVQYLITFLYFKNKSSLFLVLLFGSGLFVSICDNFNITENISGITLGISLLLISYSFNNTKYKNISPIWYFIGSLILLISYFDLVYDSIFELSYLLLVFFLIYLSITIQNKTLLFTNACGLIGFLGYYSARYFADSLGWPITLIIIGIIFLGVSGYLIKFTNSFTV